MAAKPSPIDIPSVVTPTSPHPFSGPSGGGGPLHESSNQPSADMNGMDSLSTDSHKVTGVYPSPLPESNPPSNRVSTNTPMTSGRVYDMVFNDKNERLEPRHPGSSSCNSDDQQLNERDPLIPQDQGMCARIRRLRERHCACCTKRCCVCTSVGVGAILALILGLFLVIISSISTDSSHIEYTLIEGDYVAMNINIDLAPIRQWLRSIVLTSNDTSVPVDVYKVKCNQLTQYERRHFINDTPSRYYVKDCLHHYGLCPITEYYYQVRSTKYGSVFLYRILVSPFTDDVSLNFLGYDDEAKFRKFLDGKGNEEAIYTQPIVFPVSTFSFSVSTMKKTSSYYFFALEIGGGKHIPDWYEVTRTGIHVTYEGLETIDPFCTISSNTTCTVPLPLDGYCLVGHFMDDDSLTSDNSVAVMAKITQSTQGMIARYVGIIVGCVLIVAAIIILIVTIVICIYHLKRR